MVSLVLWVSTSSVITTLQMINNFQSFAIGHFGYLYLASNSTFFNPVVNLE